MGWASGSGLAAEIWSMFRKYVPTRSRKRVALKLVDLFENEDCDTMDEAERLMKDGGLFGRWDEEEGENE